MQRGLETHPQRPLLGALIPARGLGARPPQHTPAHTAALVLVHPQGLPSGSLGAAWAGARQHPHATKPEGGLPRALEVVARKQKTGRE